MKKLGTGYRILLTIALLLMFFITFAFASQDFGISMDKETYYPGEDIYVIISGPPKTAVNVRIINPEGGIVFSDRKQTNNNGLSYLHLSGFTEPGAYTITLDCGGAILIEHFMVFDLSQITTTTTAATTTTSTTTAQAPASTSTATTTVPTLTATSTSTTAETSTTTSSTTYQGPAAIVVSVEFENDTVSYTESINHSNDTLIDPLKLITIDKHFRANEEPEFELGDWFGRLGILGGTETPEAHIEDFHGNMADVKPLIQEAGNKFKVTLPRERKIKPGLYKLVVGSSGSEEEIWFTWGLVSINTRKSVYKPNETAEMLAVVLDRDGYPVSGADLWINVTSPTGETSAYSTGEGNITEARDGVYKVLYQTRGDGRYLMDVRASVDDMMLSADSYFMVKEFIEFEILREIPVVVDPMRGPTESRIRVVDYTNTSSFSLTEYIPPEFEVTDSGGAVISSRNNTKVLTWSNLSNNSVVSYRIQLPHIWPYLYQLGPSNIGYGNKTFREVGPWYLAVDPTQSNASMILFWDRTGTPDDWTCISCAPGDPFYERFPRGYSAYGTQGGNRTHEHTAFLVSCSGPSTTSGGKSGSDVFASSETHTHTLASSKVSNESLLPRFRSLKVIQYDYGIPQTIPKGAIALFNTTPPAGWNTYTIQNNYFIYGNDSIGVGGSNTHNHSINFTLASSASTTGTASKTTSYVTSAHTHNGTGLTDNQDSRPPYITVILANASSNTSIPSGMIALFNSSQLSPSWVILSNSSGPFYEEFIVGNSSYGATGGSTNHSHDNPVITSNAPSQTTPSSWSGPQVTIAGVDHTHNVNLSLSQGSNIPPYTDVVFAYAIGSQINVSTKKMQYNSSETVQAYGTFIYSNGQPIVGENVSVRYLNSSGGLLHTDTAQTDVNGNYSSAYTLPQLTASGTYTVNVSASTGVNNAGNTSTYVVYGATNASTNYTPTSHTASSVKYATGELFNLTVSFINLGPDVAIAVNISLTLPAGLSANSTLESCGNVASKTSCSKRFEVNISANTPGGTYWINSSGLWANNNTVTNSTNSSFEVTVESNPVLEVSEAVLSNVVGHGMGGLVGVYVVNSTGNANITGVSFNCSGGNLPSDWVTYSPSGISSLAAGEQSNVSVNVSVPLGVSPGLYNCTINSSTGNDGSDTLILNVSVPVSDSWTRTPANCSTNLGIGQTGTLCTITINNTGNVPLSFNVSPSALTNYTHPQESLFNVSKQQTNALNILYNTSGALVGSHHTTYNLSSNGTPSHLLVSVNVTIMNSTFTLNITSPTQDAPSLNRSSGQNLELRAEAFYNNGTSEFEEKANINWTKVYINTTECIITDYVFVAAQDNWQINCTLPDIQDEQWYDLKIEGMKIPEYVSGQDTETNAVHYKDVTPPTISDVSVSPTVLEMQYNLSLEANVTDNLNVGSVWATVTGPTNSNESMTILAGDRYFVEYNASLPGVYTVRFHANDTPIGNQQNTSQYSFHAYGNTTGLLSQNNTINMSGITQNQQQNFNLTLRYNNTGNTTAYSVNLSAEVPAGWIIQPQATQSCSNVEVNGSCTMDFNVTVPQATIPAAYLLNGTAEWMNPDNSKDSTSNQTQVNVESNPVLEVSEAVLSNVVGHGMGGLVGVYVVNSTGNANITGVSFNCSGGNLPSDWVTYSPSGISSLAAGEQSNVSVNVSVPLGVSPGLYNCTINSSTGNDGSDTLILNVSVPVSDSWTRTPATCFKSVIQNTTGTVCTLTINNTGNVLLGFNVIPASKTNYTYPSDSSFSIPPQSIKKINIKYNTTGAGGGDQNTTTFNISSNSTTSAYLLTKVTVKIITKPPWWNSSWKYRKQIYLNESLGIDRKGVVVEANISAPGRFTNCSKELRIIGIETGESVELPFNVLAGDDLNWCLVRFEANVTSNVVNQRKHYVYYSNPAAVDPGYLSIYVNKKYNFSSGAGSNKWAYEYSSSTTTPPGSGPNIPGEVEFSSYSAIAASNNSRYTSIHAKNRGATHHFKYKLPEGYAGITGFHVLWEGYDSNSDSNLYIWNYSGAGSWINLGTGTNTVADNLINSSYYAAFDDFIDSNDILHLLAENTLGSGAASVNLYTDYSEVRVNRTFTNYSLGEEEELILPNISSIVLYNVTLLADKHSGGTLVKSGLGENFSLFRDDDYSGEGIYRVEIKVSADAKWDIASSTIVYHEGLDPAWEINESGDIWYSNGTGNQSGGSFTGGKVTWNTMPALGHADGNFTFYYIVNLTGSSQVRPVHFFINETDYSRANGLSWDEDYSSYNVTARMVFNITASNESVKLSENTSIQIFNSTGGLLAQGNGSISVILIQYGIYDILLTTPLAGGAQKTLLKSVNMTQSMKLTSQVVDNYLGTPPKNIDVTALYAQEDLSVPYSHAEITLPKNQNNITAIVHCTSWDFALVDCSSWEVANTTEYNMQENSTHFWFNVSSFDSFGGGKSKPIPNITQIRIYEVTGEADTHNGGELIDSGLNTTFEFFKRDPELYRIEIDIRNDGESHWWIAAADIVYHEGLNSSWYVDSANDIWYYTEGLNYTTGDWSGGRITWNTSQGGRIRKEQSATFYYVVNITSSGNEKYSVYFYANDTSVASGSYDNSVYNLTRVGYLEIQLVTPPVIPGQGNASQNGGYKVGQNKTFIVNATVYCRDGLCGYVNGTLRYNKSSADPDTQINTSTDTPFYILTADNPQNCSTNPLVKDEFCNLTWTVNSTGALNSIWALDVLFNSTHAQGNDTGNIFIEITKVLIMSLSWSSIDFGFCDPGTSGNNASLNNVDGYNITVDNNSNRIDEILVKGTDLSADSVGGLKGIVYDIGVRNLSWNDELSQYNHANTTQMNLTYVLMREKINPGTTFHNYYWLDVPSGKYSQHYSGTLYVLANASTG
ncbi:MAG: NEW3 domain-containing protein [Candidatus Altiarchaeota archaeon]|nr:NEW3 domain-containing protein [Candidatus Altiarchaeota archaeon]